MTMYWTADSSATIYADGIMVSKADTWQEVKQVTMPITTEIVGIK